LSEKAKKSQKHHCFFVSLFLLCHFERSNQVFQELTMHTSHNQVTILKAALLMIFHQAVAADATSFVANVLLNTKDPHNQESYFLTEDQIGTIGSSSFRNLGENVTESDHHDEDDHGEDKDKPWGSVIAFTLLVNLATLTGVLFLIPMFSRKTRAWVNSVFRNEAHPDPAAQDHQPKKEEGGSRFFDIAVPSFASGALLATAVFLVIPDGLYLIQSFLTESEEEHDEDGHRRFLEGEESEDHDEHAGEISPEAIWRFGASLLGGFMLPMLFDVLLPRNREHIDGDYCEDEQFQEDLETDAMGTTASKSTRKINYGLVLSVIAGDSLCNFSDGVFIGVALSLCDMKTAYVIVGVTLYHEIAQEIADYFLLTKHAGLTPFEALLLNFVAGLTVVVGGLAVLIASVSDMALGVVLSVAAGTYLHLACCECLPKVSAVVTTSKQRLLSMLMFIIGVVPVGLTLLNHSHCEADEH
jgi:zinc transporter ZupT